MDKIWILVVAAIVAGAILTTGTIRHHHPAPLPPDPRVETPNKVPEVKPDTPVVHDIGPPAPPIVHPPGPRPRPKKAPKRPPCSDDDWFAFKC